MSDTFDLKGAADLLHLSESSLAEMARSGEVPAAKIGKCWVFSRQLLLDWLAEETARQVASRRQPIARPIKARKSPPDLSRYA